MFPITCLYFFQTSIKIFSFYYLLCGIILCEGGPWSHVNCELAISWLVVLRLNVPVNNFSVMSGRAIASWVINQYFRGVRCLAQGHNTAEVGLEPRTSRSGVRHSTTEPPRSPTCNKCIQWNRQGGYMMISEG